MSIIDMVVIIVVAAAFVFGCYTIIYLKKNGKNVEGGLATADNGLTIANTVVDALKEAMPQNKAIGVIDKVIDYGKIGVQAAEQMAKSGQITAEQRKEQANAYITSALNAAGIEITPEIKTAIDGAVECAVAALPKSNLVNPTVAK